MKSYKWFFGGGVVRDWLYKMRLRINKSATIKFYMESEKSFNPKPEKPSVLYHASRNAEIDVFEPSIGKRRDELEGAQIFATPSKAMTTIFLVETDDSWTQSGSMDGTPFMVISDKERFSQLDTGGYIYSLPSDSFDTNLEKGLRELEYTSTEPVTPNEREFVPSALQAMLENGVNVYFVDKETWHAMQESDDDGESILKSLAPEKLEIKKSIQLTSEPLSELIRNGESLDFRLDQEAWQGLKVGDYLEFWEDFSGWQTEPTDDARKAVAKIEHIFKAPTFPELFDSIESDFSRLGDKDELLSGLRNWWSEDKEVNEGVLAFHIRLVKQTQ